MAINKQIVVGNLGKEPEVKQNQQGYLACRFTLACTEKGYTRQDGTTVEDHTEWFNIYCKGHNATFAQNHLHKGDKVYVEGKTVTREYVDQQGVKKTFTEVQADVVEQMQSRQQPMQQQALQQGYQQPMQPQQPQYNYGQQQMNFMPQQPTPQQGVFGQPAQVQSAGNPPF